MSVRLGNRPSNFLLQSLAEDDFARILPHLTACDLSRNQVLHEQDQPPGAVYFITSGVAEMSVSNEDGKQIALSLIGDEGMVGERAVFDGGLPLIRCAVVVTGTAMTLPPQVMKEEFERGGTLHEMSMRCIEARFGEIAQTALCNQTHGIQDRLARWLLTFSDRLHTAEIGVTHDDLARMLGLARPGVTIALGELENSGAIAARRGRIVVTERASLEQQACECYAVLTEAVDRALHPSRHSDT